MYMCIPSLFSSGMVRKTILSDTHCFTWSLCIWACQCDNCVDKLSRGILLTSTGQ